jgi:hypothetical protein
MSSEQASPAPIAHTIENAVRVSTICRTGIFAAIANGELPAKKSGRRTLILDADLRAWLARLPAAREMA